MRPLLHPTLVNGRSGDLALYIETLFEKRSILLDLGDIAALPGAQDPAARAGVRLARAYRPLRRIDRLLRLHVGRDKQIGMFGPEGFIDRVGHKLHGYRWNLAESYACDLVFVVTEIDAAFATLQRRRRSLRLQRTFAAEELGRGRLADGIVHHEPTFRVATAVLDQLLPVPLRARGSRARLTCGGTASPTARRSVRGSRNSSAPWSKAPGTIFLRFRFRRAWRAAARRRAELPLGDAARPGLDGDSGAGRSPT